jgi:hypothetical protein
MVGSRDLSKMDIDTSEAIETLRADLRQVEGALSAKIDVMMRHSQILYESLRDDIRMIAEGLVTLDRTVESFRRPPDLQ